MGIIYNLIFAVFAFFYIPVFLLKRKKREGIALRFGIYPRGLVDRLKAKGNIWVHAVSVGEIMAVSSLLPRLRELYPGLRLVITTVTETGNAVAKKLAADDDIVLFLPFDITFSVRKAISNISPSALIITETELWPNLIREADNKGAPVMLINGRISDASFARYRLVKFFLRPILKKIAFFCMQSKADMDRLIYLGADPVKMKISGNIKFDSAISPEPSVENREDLSSLLGIGESELLFVAGSTHPGEEEIIISSYARLKGRFNKLRLLIAPRHIERAQEVERLIIRYNFTPLRISQLRTYNLQLTTNNIFLLDTIGELRGFYSIAAIVFIGGSLVKKGGQNIIEPAILAKPILFGPYTFNFRDITALFLKEEAAIMVKDKSLLEEKLAALLESPDLCRRLGERARGIVGKNKGALDITLEKCRDILGRGI